MRLVILLASIATAQVPDGVTLRGTNDDLNIERRQVISVTEMSTQVGAEPCPGVERRTRP